jgi:hypothetical protein
MEGMYISLPQWWKTTGIACLFAVKFLNNFVVCLFFRNFATIY